MQKVDSIIFDLDGTLWDTCDTCALAWNNVVARHSIPFRDITAEDVRSVTGRPHAECIQMVFEGLDDRTLDLIISETIVEDNMMVDKLGGAMYPGVKEGLQKLSRHFKLYIVSNCQAGYIETFVRLNAFESLFEDIECWGNTGNNKSLNTASLIQRNQLRSPILVGDTSGDQVAAQDNNIPFAFVSYGFGQLDHDLRFASFNALTEWLLRDPA